MIETEVQQKSFYENVVEYIDQASQHVTAPKGIISHIKSCNSIYKFNSYRLTYRYHLISQTKIILGLGFTAKIRDANIRLYSTKQTTERTSMGFVPIINFNFEWNINEAWGLLLNSDALVAPQGRAEDIQLAITYQYSDPLNIRVGYRMLEGGTDSNSGYGFALFHYASVGFSYTFKKGGTKKGDVINK